MKEFFIRRDRSDTPQGAERRTLIRINDDGVIKIASPNGDAIQKAYDMIYSIVAEPEEGHIYKGKVVKIVDFGAFVNFFGKRDGLVHVSQIENRRLNHPSDVLKEGQEVWVKLLPPIVQHPSLVEIDLRLCIGSVFKSLADFIAEHGLRYIDLPRHRGGFGFS